MITIEISPDPLTGAKRKLKFSGLEIKADFNMVLKGVVSFYNDKDELMTDAIETDPTLTRSQKWMQIQSFRDRNIVADTTGVWVDKDGEPVEVIPVKDEQGNVVPIVQPENTVSELEFWQSLPLSFFLQGQGLPDEMMQVLGQIKFSSLFYGAIEKSMVNLDNRKRF